MTLGKIAINALNAMSEKDKDMEADKKIHRGVLSQDIFNAGKDESDGNIEIPLEDGTMINKLINSLYGPLIAMRADELLDPKLKKVEGKSDKESKK